MQPNPIFIIIIIIIIRTFSAWQKSQQGFFLSIGFFFCFFSLALLASGKLSVWVTAEAEAETETEADVQAQAQAQPPNNIKN